MRTRNLSGKEKKNVSEALFQWLATSDCFPLRLGNLRGNEDFTSDWISWRKKRSSKVQLLTLLTIEKAVSLFWEKATSSSTPSPQRGQNARAKGRGGKAGGREQASLGSCTFGTLTSETF